MTTQMHYKAFVSYSHADRDAARWLHKTLETYRVPKRLVGTKTSAGVIPPRLGPIFIDREEFPASGSLTDAVREALAQSQFLIVVCSPNAVTSPWVNEEIAEFKRIRGEAQVRCLIVAGEPHASENPEEVAAECFPEALRFQVDDTGRVTTEPSEPIAADFRIQGDGRRLARLKIIAGLIDVGLDDLVQRETQRRHRRLFGLTAASLAGMIVMSGMAWTALQAQREAQQRRAEAEDLIEFMLVELRAKLGPVGRLEVLDAVGRKALNYYADVSSEDLDTGSLARRARALHLLGEIQNLRGDFAVASEAFLESQQTTAELLARTPDAPQRIYDHAQSTFWVGFVDWRRGNHGAAQQSFTQYLQLAEKLTVIDPANTDWQLELGYGHISMGTLLMERGGRSAAILAFEKSLSIFTTLIIKAPDRIDLRTGLAETHSWMSSALLESNRLAEARDHREKELEIHNAILLEEPNNPGANYQLVPAHMHMARLLLMNGEFQAALKEFELAARLGELRIRDDPENLTTAQLTASIYLDYAEALLIDERGKEGETNLNLADAITARLLQKDRDIVKWQVQLRCRALVTHARLNLLRGQFDNGLLAAAEAGKALERLQGAHPDNQSITLLRARAYLTSGELQDAADRPLQARQDWRQTLALLNPLGDALKPEARTDLAWAQFHLNQSQQARETLIVLKQGDYRHPDYIKLTGVLSGQSRSDLR